MQKLVKIFIVMALGLGLLASCASVVGPRDIELPLHKLQAGLDRRFPLNNRMLELFEVELTRPQLTVLHDTGRVGMTMDAAITPPFSRETLRGNFALSGRLYIDPARNAVLMRSPRVERFSIDGVEGSRPWPLAKVANMLMGKVVADVPLYHFRPEDLRYGGVQFVPTGIATSPRGLVVSVAPAR